MEVWVDLNTVRRAYARCQDYSTPSSIEHYTKGIEREFRFNSVRDPGRGTRIRHKPGRRMTELDEDKEVLLDFEDEQAHIWFLLRWS